MGTGNLWLRTGFLVNLRHQCRPSGRPTHPPFSIPTEFPFDPVQGETSSLWGPYWREVGNRLCVCSQSAYALKQRLGLLYTVEVCSF